MPWNQNGMNKEDILSTLDSYKAGDVPIREGKVFGFYFDAGQEARTLVEEAYVKYLSENGLDPTSFPSLVRLEREVVRMVIDILQGDENVVGNFTSGGTESILLAVKTARDKALAERPGIKPQLILPQTAHPAFHKACHYFCIEPVLTGFSPETFRATVDDMAAAINENTILLVASAPSYAQGVIDPIEDIAQLALQHNIPFHVDACMGGMVLGFLRDQPGYSIPAYDFSVPGVTSMSCDLHKFGYAAKGASVVAYRTADLRKHQIFAETNTTAYALVNPTILSTKSGGPMAGAWAALHHFGMEGYRKTSHEAVQAARRIMQGMEATGDLYVLGKPDMCLFAVASNTLNVFSLADEMAKKGWYLQPQFSTATSPQSLHLTVTMANVPVVDDLLSDLTPAIAAVKAQKNPIQFDTVKQQVSVLLAGLGNASFDTLAAMGGVKEGEPMKEMALISSMLDAMPPETSEGLLIEFANRLFK